MTDNEIGGAYKLNEDIILLSDILNDAAYNANRYREHGYEHCREDALHELKKVRDFVDSILEEEGYDELHQTE